MQTAAEITGSGIFIITFNIDLKDGIQLFIQNTVTTEGVGTSNIKLEVGREEHSLERM